MTFEVLVEGHFIKRYNQGGLYVFTKLSIICSLIYGGNPPYFIIINESDYGIFESKVLLFRSIKFKKLNNSTYYLTNFLFLFIKKIKI